MTSIEASARARGIELSYVDTGGVTRPAPADSVRLVLRAMGETPAGREPVFARRGRSTRVADAVEVTTEDGRTLPIAGDLPGELPLGYHQLTLAGGSSRPLVVAPAACHLPDDLRGWGWAAQLYATRSEASWGFGDLADLRRLAEWSGDQQATFLLLNPLHAPLPVPPIEPSPYYPSSRRFRNPLYLAVQDVPGAAALGAELEPLARAGRKLSSERAIDRDRVFQLKLEALGRLWRRFPGDPDFESFRGDAGEPLEQFATFCVLSERLGRPWRDWPAEFRQPALAAVRRFARDHRQDVAFHAWLQWLCDRQLAAASRSVGLINDLALGTAPDGADAWVDQAVLAPEVEVGAPPDDFNREGQKWGFPPYAPERLRAAVYAPFVAALRAAFRHGAGIRLDHVLGLFRLYWVPAGRPADAGVYVRYPDPELLDIVALESHRAQGYVVGEDLGTFEERVREELARRKLLSYRVFWFEDRPPPEYPVQALASVTTHDLPTVAGVWTGADLENERRAGRQPSAAARQLSLERLGRWASVPADASPEDAVLGAYRALAKAPSRLLAATLEDALAATERPNLPGTWGPGSPSWRLGLPAPLEQLLTAPLARRLAAVLARPDS